MIATDFRQTRCRVMRRAWQKMRRHMHHNRFTRYLMARFLREAWAEVKAAMRNLVQPSELSPIDHALASLEGLNRLTRQDLEDLAAVQKQRAQRVVQPPKPSLPVGSEWLAFWGLMFLSRRHAVVNQPTHHF